MASTVNTAFNEFHRDLVNLNPDRTDTARKSRDWLFGQLNLLPQKEVGFPKSYEERHNKYGSFARKTKIRELDDVDIIFGLSATGATYSKSYFNNNEYFLSTELAGQTLKDLSDDGYLNSNKVINKIKSGLSKVEHYTKADIHKKHEAVTLKLSSYEWNFDILPAFYTVEGFYLIPNGKGAWKATNPDIDQERVTKINQKHGGKILQLIRTLKYWNRWARMPFISSYLFENIVINYFESRDTIEEYIDYNLRDFWGYLVTGIYSPVHDPKGFDNDINNLSYTDKLSISNEAQKAYDLSKEAIYSEIHESNQKKAIDKWREIFVVNFPIFT